ncbi:MAG: hypothetical protein UV64_C0014G0018 [Parcubacteria group bacterium GW2011_GWC1_43_11b]|nr:MAG: hypothetical protein UV64_C0014G0018 [Parcubacteria group bacterium GW2011_GWC1_43_11b]
MSKNIFTNFNLAEGVGLEPTNGFFDRYGLANRCLTIRRNPP